MCDGITSNNDSDDVPTLLLVLNIVNELLSGSVS